MAFGDDLKNLAPGQTVGSFVLNKNLKRLKKKQPVPKVGYQGKTSLGMELPSTTLGKQQFGNAIPTMPGEVPMGSIDPTIPRRPRIHDLNDQIISLSKIWQRVTGSAVSWPGVALDIMGTAGLDADGIPFLFDNPAVQNVMRDWTKRVTKQLKPETITDLITGLPKKSLGLAGKVVGGFLGAVSSTSKTMEAKDASEVYMEWQQYSAAISPDVKAATNFPTSPPRIGDEWSAWKTRAREYLGKQKYGKPYSPFVVGQGGEPGAGDPLEIITSTPKFQQTQEKYKGMSVGEYAQEFITNIIAGAKQERRKVTAKPGTQQRIMQAFGEDFRYSKDPVAETVLSIANDPLTWAIPISAASRKIIITAANAGKISLSGKTLTSLKASSSFSEFFLRVGMREGWARAGNATRTVLGSPAFRKLADKAGYIRFPWKAKGGDVSNVEVFTREVLRRPRETLKQLGKGGDELERMMIKALLEGEEAGGRAITRTRALFEKLPEKDWGHFVNVMEGKANPKDKLVAELADKVGLYRDYIAKIAPKMDFKIYNPKTGKLRPWTPVKDYFPRDLDWNLIKKNRDALADYLLQTKQVKDIDEARKILSRQRWGEATAKHLEIARTFKLPDKYYVKSPQLTWERYVEEINKRLYERKVFGRKYKNAFTAIEDIRKEIGGEDAKWAHDVFMEHVKKGITNKKDFTTPIRNYHIATKMTLSAIQNSTQKFVNEALDGNIRGILKATTQYRTAVGKEKALQTGAILRGVLEDQMRRIGLHADSLSGRVASEALKIQKFSATETYNRIFTALKSFDQLDWAFKKLVKNPKSKKYRSMFKPLVRYFDFDLDKAIKAGKLPNAKLQRMYANYQVIRKHFRGGSLFKPPVWNTRSGKLLTQFKTFIYDQGALVKDAIKDGIKNNNYTPLIALLTVFPAIGQIPAEFYAKIRGRERRWTGKDRVPGLPWDIPAPIARYIEGISYVGGFGLAYEILQSAEFGEKGIAGLLLGVTGSDVVEAGKGVYQATTEKKPADLAKWLVKQVPGVGATLRRKIYSEKGQPRWVSLETRRILEQQREKGEESTRITNDFLAAVKSNDKQAIKDTISRMENANYPLNVKSLQYGWSTTERMGKNFWQLSDVEKRKAWEKEKYGIEVEGKPSIPLLANKAIQEYLKAKPGGEKLLADLIKFKVDSIGAIGQTEKLIPLRGKVRAGIAQYIAKYKVKESRSPGRWKEFLGLLATRDVPLEGASFNSKEGKPRQEAFKLALDKLKNKDKQFAREFLLLPSSIWNW